MTQRRTQESMQPVLRSGGAPRALCLLLVNTDARRYAWERTAHMRKWGFNIRWERRRKEHEPTRARVGVRSRRAATATPPHPQMPRLTQAFAAAIVKELVVHEA